MLLVVDPPMNGREALGHNSTIATHQPADTTIATPVSASCQMRLPSLGGPAMR